MHDSLRSLGLIPLTEPYTGPPFNYLPIGESAGETILSNVLLDYGAHSIVDWVLLEIRDAGNPSTLIANKRALLQRDGDIVSTDGVSPVEFNSLAPGSYKVSVKHRNHLGVMTLLPINFDPCSIALVDFSNPNNLFSDPLILNTPSRSVGSFFALWSGDARSNKNVKFNGILNDKDAILASLGGNLFINNTLYNIYRAEDVNLDGKIRYNGMDNDRIVILNSVGISTPNNVIYQHTPN
jgi:hypothetical protein